MEKIESNKLIAEFMGLTYKEENDSFDNRIIRKVICKGHPDRTIYQDINYHFQLVQLKYHNSWNWLMPVLEKIGTIELPNDIYENGKRVFVENIYPRTFGMKNDETGKFMFRFNGFSLFQSEKLIDAAHLAVIEVLRSQIINKQ